MNTYETGFVAQPFWGDFARRTEATPVRRGPWLAHPEPRKPGEARP